MKKLFFTAFVAIIAVGGAYADIILYNSAGQPIVTCKEEGSLSCAEFTQAFYESDGTTLIPYSFYSSLFYI